MRGDALGHALIIGDDDAAILGVRAEGFHLVIAGFRHVQPRLVENARLQEIAEGLYSCALSLSPQAASAQDRQECDDEAWRDDPGKRGANFLLT